jgi:EAL domain-containing protein (putative c-di-GMP-specific phosphodiesterase class I)
LTHTPADAERPIAVLLVDDHQMILDSLVRILGEQSDMVVVATATTCAEAVVAAARQPVDVVVMDYRLPDGDGVTAAVAITRLRPATRVIILTGSDIGSALFEAVRGLCAGYLEKTNASDKLTAMIRLVHHGEDGLPVRALAALPEVQELVVHYQPIVDMTTEHVVGFEALVRWAHPERGILLPAAFIDLAERTGAIVDIDEQVRLVACRQSVEWQERFPASPARFMSVNLSGRELRRADVTDRVFSTVQTVGVEPSSMVLEVTETFLMEGGERQVAKLLELRHQGFRIALDDFGTAYSSLDYLHRFPVDIIKIDKSFVDEVPHGPRAVALLRAISSLAGELRLECEAEGIETAEQAAALVALGYKLGQGYHYARPQSAEDLEGLLVAHSG